MWNNGNSPGARTLTPGGVNSMRPFENSAAGIAGGAQHRTNFNAFVTGLASSNGTPSHSIASRVDTYMRDTSVNSPWKNRPGVANSPELSCRRTYHVFMTDGSWNTHDGQTAGTIIPAPPRVGNVDGSIQNLPTPDPSVTDSFTQTIPTQYTPFSPETRLYGDNWSTSFPTVTVNPFRWDSPRTAGRDLGTLSDFSFNSWVKDLQPNIPNAVRPLIKKQGNETFGTGTAATTLPEFWNPKNNPATWQHVVTHTIGFGTSASTWCTIVGQHCWCEWYSKRQPLWWRFRQLTKW
jgi:type IV pilus assembly protein PilY1